MHQEHLKKAELITKYLQGRLDEKEEREFYTWVNENEQNALMVRSFIEGDAKEDADFYSSVNLQSAWEKVSDKTIKKQTYFSVFWRYAASISVLLIAAALVFYFVAKNGDQKPALAISNNNEVAADEKKAILELQDGSKIALEDVSNGILTKQTGSSIVKNESLLIYTNLHSEDADKISWNRLSTPNGKQYKVVLSDGTEVWLNAASSLRYPAVFSRNERIVELKGEAYFEVAKMRDRPFKVRVDTVNIEVLGTHFNVMAYENEQMIKTTLLEGAVKVSTGKKDRIIAPGQQARVSGNELLISEVDPDEAIAWKNGFFQFNNSDLGSVMKQLERWYDVKLNYKGNIEDKHFTGIISKENNISQVLKMLETTGNVAVEVESKSE